MINNQMNIFDVMYKPFKIDKPIRIIELFGGYGSQSLSLKYLGVKFEHWKLCEWAIKSIQAYKDIHYPDDFIEVLDLSKDDIIDYLYKKGISQNYNEPMTLEQIKRLSDEKLYTIYENIIVTNNLVNIQQVKGEDLEIVDTDKYCYIMTYSFPCQDLSLAGKGKGMSDTSTRSGMLWEVERILSECKNKPQVLIMENVIQVHSEDNLPDFNKWKNKLEDLGYKNYWQDLIATDYGIPQTRNRCFMVSILGDYNYTFPKPIPLKLKLKDLLEDNVDDKYYLSDKMLRYITSKDDKYKVNENNLVINRKIACSKTTREGWTRADTTDYICDDLPENYNIKNGCKQIYDLNYYNHEQSNRVYDVEYSSPTLRTKCDDAGTIKIINATQKGYIEATDGDGIDLAQPNSTTRRGRVQKGKVQTLTTQNNLGVIKDMKIRKLTPRECFRLMGVRDEDYDKVCKNQSDNSLYHLAGDSIVVDVIKAIFKEML